MSKLISRTFGATNTAIAGLHLASLVLFAMLAFPQSGTAASCDEMPAPGLDWSECSKKHLMLQASDLKGANLGGADLSLTDLSNSDVSAANLEKATLVRTWLNGATAEKANFSRIEAYRSSFAEISASGASFASAELQRADFNGAQLSGADFEKAELGRANFKDAVISGARFTLANLSRANLAGATFEKPILLDQAFLFLTHIEGLDLSKSEGLQQQQIDLACGDDKTKLPDGLTAPSTWPCPSD